MKKEIKMVVRAVLDQGEKKGFKRWVGVFGKQKVVKIWALGSVFPQELFFPPKICDPFEEERRLFGSGPAP